MENKYNFPLDRNGNFGYAVYHAIHFAEGSTNEEIQEEINRCEQRYYKPYAWNGTENAQNTINRIDALKKILEQR
jgi:hypothetical protein